LKKQVVFTAIRVFEGEFIYSFGMQLIVFVEKSQFFGNLASRLLLIIV